MGSVRTFRWVLVLAALVLPSVIAFARPANDVGAVVDRWATAFNSNDVDALVNLYAPDAILVGTAGLTLKVGREAIRSYFARLAKSGDKVVIDDRKITVLDDNVAYVTGFYVFDAVRNGEMRKSPAGFTMVIVKRGNDWLIAHHHSSRRALPSPVLPVRRG
jgi:uncharacterized protein (TIGR02246 family)